MKTLITALLAVSITGAAFAGSYNPTANGVAEITATGAYKGTSTASSMYVEGGTDSTPSFGVLDFASTGISGTVSALTINLTGWSTTTASTAGTLHFYTTTASTVSDATGITYGTGAGTTNGIVNSQFNNSVVDLGALSYAAQTSAYQTYAFTLNINTAAQAALASEIASGEIRILVAVDNAPSSALFGQFQGIETNSNYAYEDPTASITTQPAPEPISTAIVIGALGTAIAKRRKRA